MVEENLNNELLMKPLSFLSSCCALGLTVFSVSAEKVTFQELPKAVQETVENQSAGARIEDIDKMSRSGREVYEVAFRRDGKLQEVLVRNDGVLLDKQGRALRTKGAAEKADRRGSEQVNIGSVPTPVQQTIRAEADVEAIDSVTKKQATVYVVAFKEDGTHTEMALLSDGTILKEGKMTKVTRDTSEPLSNAVKVDWKDVPGELQQIIQRQAGSARIEDVERGLMGRLVVYEAAFKEDGEHVELRVADNGWFPAGPKDVVNMAGAPLMTLQTEKIQARDLPRKVLRAVQSVAGNAPLQDIERKVTPVYEIDLKGRDDGKPELVIAENGFFADMTDGKRQVTLGRDRPLGERPLVPLAGASKVSWEEVPDKVKETVRSKAGEVRIEDVDRGTWRGQTVYQFAFKSGEQHVELQVRENGELLNLPAIGAEAD